MHGRVFHDYSTIVPVEMRTVLASFQALFHCYYARVVPVLSSIYYFVGFL